MFDLRPDPRTGLYRAAGHWREVHLLDLVRGHAELDGRKPAIIDGAQVISYNELVRKAEAVARGLLDLGVGGGDVVSVQLPNWWEFGALLLGIEAIGAVMNPLAVILRERELEQMLRLGLSKVLVVPEIFRGFAHTEMAQRLVRTQPSLEVVITIRGSDAAGTLRFEDMATREVGETERQEIAALKPPATCVCELAFTSGTTGEPKGVLHTHQSAIATVESTIRRQRLGRDDVFHVATPLGHNAGYFYGLRIALQSGGTALLQDTWDPGLMVELLSRHGATFTMGTTTFLIDFLNAARRQEQLLSSLRTFTCGGASIPPAVAEECEARFPGVLCPVFGMTEMGHATATGPESPRVKALTTDGSAQPEMDLKIVSADGRDASPGKEGVLKFRGPFLFAGYVQGRNFTETYFDDEGFFDTGDLAYCDEDGYIRVTGRVKDLIIRGGENVPVREIEDILAEHPSVLEVAVVGMPDPRLGERAVACVRPRQDSLMTLEDMRRYLNTRNVARQFWPEAIRIVDEFPTTPAGKIRKAELKRILAHQSFDFGS